MGIKDLEKYRHTLEFIRKIQSVMNTYDHKTFESGKKVLNEINKIIIEESKSIKKIIN